MQKRVKNEVFRHFIEVGLFKRSDIAWDGLIFHILMVQNVSQHSALVPVDIVQNLF